MKPVNSIFLTFLIFSITISAFAQPPYPEWKQYLTVLSVNKMKLDSNILYASTSHFGFGLIALDLNTNETEVFSEYSAGIANDDIDAIDIDAEGNIWLGHYGYGISKLSDNNCIIFNTGNSGIINDSITTLCVDLNGKIWIGTWSGICSFDGQEWESYTHNNSGLPNDTVYVITTDAENNKWIGLNGGFTVFDENNWENHEIFTPSVYDPAINNIIIDENGTAWIDAHQYNSALYKFDGDSIEYMNWPSGTYNYISDMDFDSEGNMWISIWSGMNSFGLAMFDGIEFTQYDFSEMSDYIRNHSQSLEIDANNNKWIGTTEDGLVKYSEGSIKQINEGIYSLYWPHANIAFENNNRVWMATSHGLTEYNSGDWNYYSYYNSDYPSKNSRCIAIDKNNKKWIGSDDQLITYDDINWFIYDTSNSPIEYGYGYIKNIVIDKHDNKWFTKNGLYKFDNENWSYYNTENSAIPSDGIQCIAADSDGVIWMGHLGIGISSFNGDNWVLFDTTIAGPQIFIPWNIYIDSINTKWICTQTGLLSFDGNSWTVYDTSNTDLPSNSIWDCIFDNTGKLWVGTIKGIGVFDGTEWIIYDSTNSSLKRNSIRGLYKSENNTIWITVGQGGLSVYNENGFLGIETDFQNFKPGIELISYPNPFKSETNFQFNLSKNSLSEIIIYNIKGQIVKKIFKGKLNAGETQFSWGGTNDNGSFVNQGIYFCQLQTAESSANCKVVFLRD